jgi:hypothetical protein
MDMRFGTWKETVASELAKYNLDILAVKEVRWDKGGSQPINDCLHIF